MTRTLQLQKHLIHKIHKPRLGWLLLSAIFGCSSGPRNYKFLRAWNFIRNFIFSLSAPVECQRCWSYFRRVHNTMIAFLLNMIYTIRGVSCSPTARFFRAGEHDAAFAPDTPFLFESQDKSTKLWILWFLFFWKEKYTLRKIPARHRQMWSLLPG